ncbi:MAG: hypothetical protein ACHQ1D_00915 [Nitrososphaerales archaeon]
MDIIRGGADRTRPIRVRELLEKLVEEKREKEKKVETKKKTRKWNWPMGWKGRMNKATKQREKVLVFYLNIKGEIEQPMVIPLYGGNMVIIRNKVYEVDPRAFWMVKAGFKSYKVLMIKEIDRRPVSNLDYSEIKKRGDATDSDEFLIKAALRAQTQQMAKPVNKALIFIIGIIVLGVIGYVFFAS